MGSITKADPPEASKLGNNKSQSIFRGAWRSYRKMQMKRKTPIKATCESLVRGKTERMKACFQKRGGKVTSNVADWMERMSKSQEKVRDEQRCCK